MADQIGRAEVQIGADTSEFEARLRSLKYETAKTLKEIGSMRAKAEVDVIINDNRAKINALKQNIADIHSGLLKVDDAKKVLANLNRELGDLTRQNERLNSALAAQEAILRQQAKRWEDIGVQQDRMFSSPKYMNWINALREIDAAEERLFKQRERRNRIESLQSKARMQQRLDEANAELAHVTKMADLRARIEQLSSANRMRLNLEEANAEIAEAERVATRRARIEFLSGENKKRLAAEAYVEQRRIEDQQVEDAELLAKITEGLSRKRRRQVMEEINGAGGLREYIKQQRLSNSLQMEASSARGLLGLTENKRSGIWATLTNSKNMQQTIAKLMREPVKLGPFTATVKGLTVGFTALGPIVASLIGGLSAMAATVGGALTSAFTLGVGGAIGFGQSLLGVSMIVGPYLDQVDQASKATDHYAQAVAKYGKDSKQATKAQEQMNNVLKSMSPTARAAFKDLQQAQTVFASMTKASRPALDRALAGATSTFKQLAPNFAGESMAATRNLSGGLVQFFARLRQEERGGKGFLAETFHNANMSMTPLLRGMGSLTLALGNIGAAASRNLPKLTQSFSRLMEGFLGKTSDKNSLNRSMDGLYKDFTTVGKSIFSATRLLKDFFNAGRSTGRGLFESLTSTFDRWDRFIKSTTGQAKLQSFFTQAGQGFKTIGSVIGVAVRGFVLITQVLSPFAHAARVLADAFTGIISKMQSMRNGVTMLQSSLVGLAAGWGTYKALMFLETIAKLPGAFRAAAAAMSQFAASKAAADLGGFTRLGMQAGKGRAAFGAAMSGEAVALSAAQGSAAGAAIEQAGVKAATSARQLSLFGGAAASAATATAGAEVAAGGLAAAIAGAALPIALAVGVVGALAYGLINMKSKADEADESIRKLHESLKDNEQQSIQNTQNLASAYQNLGTNIQSARDAKAAFDANPSPQNRTALDEATGRVISDRIDVRNTTKDEVTNWREALNKKGGINETLRNLEDKLVPRTRRGGGGRGSIGRTRKSDFELMSPEDKARFMVDIREARRLRQGYLDAINGADVMAKRRQKPGYELANLNPQKLASALGQLKRVAGNTKLAVQVATNVQDPAKATQVANLATKALQHHVSQKKVKQIIEMDKNSPDKMIKDLNAEISKKTVKGKPVNVSVKATADKASGTKAGNALKKAAEGPAGRVKAKVSSLDHSEIDNYKPKTIHVKAVVDKVHYSGGTFATGGVHAANKGYMVDTAWGRAANRPRKSAMGKFNEPTFLVGEENRTEYVIATNPAYRSQNRMYLAAAANELGMNVMPAASGFTPAQEMYGHKKWAAVKHQLHHNPPHSWLYYADKKRDADEAAARRREDNIDRAEALGFADSPASMSKAEKAKRKRLKTLLRRERDYKTIKNPSTTRYNHHKDDVDEIRSIRRWIRNSVHIMSMRASSRYKVLNTELGTFDSRMSLAEKTGDTAAFTAAQKAQERNILELLRKDKRALSGARTAAQKATIQAEIDSLNERLFDNRNKTIGGYAGDVSQAKVDQLNAQVQSLQNENVINSMFGNTRGGLGDILASGGPRRSGRGGAGPVIHINTLVPSDQATLDTINDVVVGAMSTQGNRIAAGMTVG